MVSELVWGLELLILGALTGFMLVNLSVVNHYYVRLRERAGWGVWQHLVFPLVGAAVCGILWLNLTGKAKLAGCGWLLLGAVYLALLTRGFRVAPATLGSLEVLDADNG